MNVLSVIPRNLSVQILAPLILNALIEATSLGLIAPAENERLLASFH